MNFKSDNAVGIHPQVLKAINDANTGYQPSYGGDEYSQKLTQKVSEIFETDVTIFLTATGTGANSLALSSIVPPHGFVYCHPNAHINTDECGAPEFFSGAKLKPIDGEQGKINPTDMRQSIEHEISLRPHGSKPAAISVTQMTESGTVYSIKELETIKEIKEKYDMHMHMDGARFANALVTLGCTPAQMTWEVGVDVLSFGGTKNGAMVAEMIVFFNKDLAHDFDYRHKRGGQLLSKTRFIAAQFLALFEQDLWLHNARHANQMASRLARELKQFQDLSIKFPVQGNEIFIRMPAPLVEYLYKNEAHFYPYGPGYKPRDPDVYRLVTSFVTKQEEIDEFIGLFKRFYEL